MTASLFTFHLRNLQPAPSRSRRTNTPAGLDALDKYVEVIARLADDGS
jgi:hypothetical protein